MTDLKLYLIIAVLLPPSALDVLGDVVEERVIDTPHGPVGPLARRTHETGAAIWVHPYMGSPSRTDPRATIHAACALGADAILHWDGAIALAPELQRGQTALVADYIDGTHRYPATFQTDGSLASGMAIHAVDSRLKHALAAALPDAPDVVYLGLDGPRRETAAEARMYRAWGADVLGQNMVPEIGLAAEVTIPFAGLVTVMDGGAHRPAAATPGAVRHGLERTVAALPVLLHHLTALA